jgi:hypothetical protein
MDIVEQLLLNMQQEQRNDRVALEEKIEGVGKKVDNVKTSIDNHNIRLIRVEATRKVLLWLAGSATVAGLGAVAEFVVNHLFKGAVK